MHILYSVQPLTHPGKVRENNEDALGTALDWQKMLELSDDVMQQRGHLFAVADGMGGHAAGEVASQMAIDILFTEYYTGEWQGPRKTLISAIESANRAIWEKASAHAGMSGMGTTLVAALYRPDAWLIANVGDSRAYLFRGGRIKQITQDHSWVSEQVNSGILTEEEAARHPFRNVITRSLGGEASVQIDFFELDAQPGDIALLCSDGLSNLVGEKEMQGILQAYALDEAAERFLELSLERGAPDNVTFELIQLVGEARRHSSSFLPWLALGVAAFLIAGFMYWNFAQTPEESGISETSGAAVLSTFTPVTTPEPSPSPPAVTKIVQPPKPSRMLQSIGMSLEHDFPNLFYTEDENPTMVLVSGKATVEPAAGGGDVVEVEGIVGVDGEQAFRVELDREKYVDVPPETGDAVVVAGYAVEGWEEETGDITLAPVLLMTPLGPDESGSYRFRVVWQKDADAVGVFLDRFGMQDGVETIEDAGVTILKVQ